MQDTPRTFTVRSSDIGRCPHHRLDPGHYDDDGTCGCNKRGEFTLTLRCTGAAFDPPEQEVARLLRVAADRVEDRAHGVLLDSNGNAVGRWGWTA